ncbi:zinc finger protein ZFMSA12A-like [Hippocampus zosterae]|uniref:zinc finger protein ZFMSA12A-like n=1 Tax=Hippocampus zosterae TaxID=109293 RepID=UPI00223D3808|nr:zinc finger protein ZFMSA12A-like [Hippocampus zosterae]
MEGSLSLPSLRLLAPPLRVMSAIMWKVVHLRSTKHYGRVVEFITLVNEAIPDILTHRQWTLIMLGLKLKMLSCEPDVKCVKTVLESILLRSSEQAHPTNDPFESNLSTLVLRLVDDHEWREHFLKNEFPVHYGPDFDTALETLVSDFFNRLDGLLLIPDFKQTSLWVGNDASTLLEAYQQYACEAEDFPALLRRTIQRGKLAKINTNDTSSSEQQLLSSLTVPVSTKENNSSCQSVIDNSRECFRQSTTDAEEITWTYVIQQDLEICSQEETVLTTLNNNKDEVTVELVLDDQPSAATSVPDAPAPHPVTSGGRRRQRVAHKCTHCNKCYIYRYELLEHQRIHTGELPYKCTQCGKAFRRSSDLSCHRRSRCRKAAYICLKCGNSFQSIQEKFKHRCLHNTQKLECSQCRKSFKKTCQLEKHQLIHTRKRLFTCRQCGEKFSSMSELKFHRKTHPAGLSNQCTRCGKMLPSAASLAAHEERHEKQKTHACAVCAKSFRNKHELTRHKRMHTGERPYQCPYCEKRFYMSANLTVHIRTHTGEKPYLCPDCGKAFASAGELQIHGRIHTGERPYKCNVCDKGFTMAAKLTCHMRVHTGERPYVCADCGKGFSSSGQLKIHNMSHTGVRPYPCQLCPKGYKVLNHLKRHLKSHGIQEPSV